MFLKRLEWALHNGIAHPLVAILELLYLDGLAYWLHELSMPQAEEGYLPMCSQFEIHGEEADRIIAKLQELEDEEDEDE